MKRFHFDMLCLLTCYGLTPAHAQTPPQVKTKVSQVVIKIEVNGKQTESGGTLYKVEILSGALSPAAQVNEHGTILPEFTCSKDDQLFAKPTNAIAITDEKPKNCAEKMTFNYKIPGLSWASADLNKATVLAQQGKYGEANSIYFGISTDAASKGQFEAARLADAGFVATAAKIIGGDQWNKYVTLDPKQNYKLAFSERGITKIKEIQKNEKIPITGLLDVDTKQALLKQKGASASPQYLDHTFSFDPPN
jgi:hypothetical protein